MSTPGVTTTRPDLPGYWRFLWLLFMQPIRLHRRLRACGIDPEPWAWALWRSAGARSVERLYVRRMAWVLLSVTPVLALLLAGGCAALGVPVNWLAVASGVAIGVAGGLAVGVGLGVALCLSTLPAARGGDSGQNR